MWWNTPVTANDTRRPSVLFASLRCIGCCLKRQQILGRLYRLPKCSSMASWRRSTKTTATAILDDHNPSRVLVKPSFASSSPLAVSALQQRSPIATTLTARVVHYTACCLLTRHLVTSQLPSIVTTSHLAGIVLFKSCTTTCAAVVWSCVTFMRRVLKPFCRLATQAR